LSDNLNENISNFIDNNISDYIQITDYLENISGYDPEEIQTLKNVYGVIQWTTDNPPE
jgi:hypothetical protein